MRVSVTPRQMTDTPVSELLYGNFIELGYGLQVEGMWGEMLFNRSFEQFAPYRPANVEWFDLWNDPDDHSKGYRTDWRGEGWYHSAYEHDVWFAAPGDGGPFRIDDRSTFFINRSPVQEAEIEPIRQGARHGEWALRVVNHEEARWSALAQGGKALRRGEMYHFHGWMRSEGGRVEVEARFYPEGDWEHPIATIPLGPVGPEFKPKSFSFRNRDFEGRAVFSIWIPPQSSVVMDEFSLVPSATLRGWRRDVVSAMRQVGPTVLRWPGGCFASFYDWREGIGSPSQRKPRPSYFWGGMNYNDVGTAELALLAREVGAESMVCVNVYHPRKQRHDHYFDAERCGAHGRDFPQFTDVEQGARDAADWVAYCNAPVNHPMGALRAEHGYPQPFGVRFWELDNEVARWFQPDEYARAAVVYSQAMKAVDPTIDVGLVSYDDAFTDSLETMLEIAGPHVNFLADRRVGEADLDPLLARVRAYNARTGARLRYCNTEWLPLDLDADAYRDADRRLTRSAAFGTWRYGLDVLRSHMMWQRKGGEVLFVNFNNLANTHAQSAIETPKEGVFLTAAGRALELLSHSPAAWPLVLEGYASDDRAPFQVQAALDRYRDHLVLYALNMNEDAREATFDITALDRRYDTAETTVLSADSLLATNTLAEPDAIRREERTDRRDLYGACTVVAPPFSFTQVVLSRHGR